MNAQDHRDQLKTRMEALKRVMLTGKEYTLPQLTEMLGGSESGVSAQVRKLRRPEHGGHNVVSRRIKGGTYGYRVKPRVRDQVQSELFA